MFDLGTQSVSDFILAEKFALAEHLLELVKSLSDLALENELKLHRVLLILV